MISRILKETVCYITYINSENVKDVWKDNISKK